MRPASGRRSRLRRTSLLAVGLAALIALLPVRRLLVASLSHDYTQGARADGVPLRPVMVGADASRRQLAITLEKVASGIEQPTDIQFPPGVDGMAVVLSKTGAVHYLALDSGHHGVLLEIEVLTASEQGLLGLAFHPRYRDNGLIVLDYVARDAGRDVTRIEAWRVTPPDDLRHAKLDKVRTLLSVEQPYQNHNAGQLAFGPDGMLYVGFGDGGFRDDPHDNGQNPSTLLGSMLRIDVDHASQGKPYAVPKDNPLLGKAGIAPETFAYGLRNPWRFAFDPRGRLIVADVGQDTWEEVDIVRAGDNLGWNLREGFACAQKDRGRCERSDLVDPVLVYGRGDGASITGGYVYEGARVPALKGLYVFGDFVSGRLFAIALPDDRKQRVQQPIALGQWPLMPSTFGRDAHGELYVASFATGDVYRIAGPAAGTAAGTAAGPVH